MPEQIALNIDCMEYMKSLPDGAFDLAVVDPPYGDGGQDFKRSDKSRFGGVFDKYRSQSVNVERESKVTRTGGTWAEKFGKKS